MMWIRSQCKTTLIEVKNISTDDGVILHYNGDETYTILGEYSTEEKAIKVLDMIQEFIEGQKLMMDVANSSSLIKQYVNSTETKVFQMPQEEKGVGV